MEWLLVLPMFLNQKAKTAGLSDHSIEYVTYLMMHVIDRDALGRISGHNLPN